MNDPVTQNGETIVVNPEAMTAGERYAVLWRGRIAWVSKDEVGIIHAFVAYRWWHRIAGAREVLAIMVSRSADPER